MKLIVELYDWFLSSTIDTQLFKIKLLPTSVRKTFTSIYDDLIVLILMH